MCAHVWQKTDCMTAIDSLRFVQVLLVSHAIFSAGKIATMVATFVDVSQRQN